MSGGLPLLYEFIIFFQSLMVNHIKIMIKIVSILCLFWWQYFTRSTSSGDSRNFVQDVPIPLWKNFGSFQDVSINTSRNSRFDLKKKNIKTKTNLHFVHRKTSKGKKMKRKEMNKVTYTINYKFIWNIKKIINYYFFREFCFINLFVFYKL